MADKEAIDLRNEITGSGTPVYVCFTAPWCQTCYPACLVTSELIQEYNGQIKFVEVNVEKHPELAEEYQVKAVPTGLIFQDGRPVKRILSYQDKSQVKDALDAIAGG